MYIIVWHSLFSCQKADYAKFPVRVWHVFLSFLLHAFHDACINRVHVIWPMSYTKYQLLVITMVAIMRRSLAEYFLMPAGAIPPQWGYVS